MQSADSSPSLSEREDDIFALPLMANIIYYKSWELLVCLPSIVIPVARLSSIYPN